MTTKWKILFALSVALNLSIGYVGYKALEYRAHINYYLDKYNRVVEEFSGREVYESANQQLRSDSTVARRVVLFGSQVVRGWSPGGEQDGYEFINRGVDSQRVAGFLLRFRPDVVDLMPEAVVIEVSSYNLRPNTTLAEVKDYLVSLIDLAYFHRIRPIPCTMIPVQEGYEAVPETEYRVADSIVVFNEWLREWCKVRGLDYLDSYKLLSGSEGLLADSLSSGPIDPNEAGYARMTEALRELLGTAAS